MTYSFESNHGLSESNQISSWVNCSGPNIEHINDITSKPYIMIIDKNVIFTEKYLNTIPVYMKSFKPRKPKWLP